MYYTFKEIQDRINWDTFVENYDLLETGIAKTTFTQSSAWGDFQEKLGFETYRFGIYSSNKLIGVGLGIIINAKRGKYIYFRNGPIIDWDNRNLVDQTIQHLKSYAKEKGLWFIRMSPLVEKHSTGSNIIKEYNFPKFAMNDVEALDTWIMNISDSEENVKASIKKKTRYYINKAQKDGVKTLVTTDSKHIDDFYKIYEDTVARHKWTSYTKAYILNEFKAFSKNDQATLILMKYKNKIIGGGFFIHYGNQSFYQYGATLSEYSTIPAAYLMIWEAIRESKLRGKKFFNFWGIAPSDSLNHPWSGLTMFKKKFPGFEQKWLPAHDIPVSNLYWLTNLYDRYDKKRKGY